MKTNVIALGARYNDFTALMQEVMLPMAAKHLRQKTPMLSRVHLDSASDVQTVGDQISIQMPYKLSPMERLQNGQKSTPDTLNANKVTMKIDTNGVKDIVITNREWVTHANNNTLPGAFEAAVEAISDGINQDIHKTALKCTYSVEGTNTGNARTKADLIAARKHLVKKRAPSDGRFFFPTSESEADILNFMSNAAETGDTKAYRGEIGRLFEFDIVSDPGLDDVYTAGDAGTDYTVSGAHAAGSNSVTVSTAGATGFKMGDIVSFAGTEGTYCVQEDLSGPGELSIFPSLQADVADSAVVTALGEHRVDIAMHKSSVGIAFRGLEVAQGVASGADIYNYTDPVTGIPMRVVSFFDPETRSNRWIFEVLYGCTPIRPELSVRVLGQ